jgi:hypothetical protein
MNLLRRGNRFLREAVSHSLLQRPLRYIEHFLADLVVSNSLLVSQSKTLLKNSFPPEWALAQGIYIICLLVMPPRTPAGPAHDFISGCAAKNGQDCGCLDGNFGRNRERPLALFATMVRPQPEFLQPPRKPSLIKTIPPTIVSTTHRGRGSPTTQVVFFRRQQNLA